MSALRRFLPVVALIGAGIGLAPSAGAQTADPPPAADPCATVFEAPTIPALRMATDPAPRSDVIPGQQISLDGSWDPAAWESVAGVRACVEVDRDVDPAYGAAEEPGVNDGAFAHAFTVPEIVNGTVICARMTMAGDPTGPETSARWVSKQACFEGHPEQTEPPPPPTAGPVIPTTTTTTSAPAPASPTTTPPTTVPARQGETPRAAPPVTPRSNPTPAAPAQPGRVGDDTDDAPPLPVPVDLPELPRTGAGTTAGLVTAGLAALAGGALTRISVRRSRRR